MKVFAVLLLAGAVAASAIPEQQQGIEQGIEQGLNLNSDSRSRSTSNINSKLFTIYGAPLISREHLLSEERMGLRGLVDKSFIVAYKPMGSNEMKAFLLKGGLSSLPNNPDAVFLKEMLLNSPEKVGITLSGAHFLDLPELGLPIRVLHMPHDYNLHSAFRIAQDGSALPWVYIVSKDELRFGSLEKLSELGQMEMRPEGLKVLRELPSPSTSGSLVRNLYGFGEEPVFQVIPSSGPSSGFIAPESGAAAGLRKVPVHYSPIEVPAGYGYGFGSSRLHYLTPSEAAGYGKIRHVPVTVPEAGLRLQPQPQLQLQSVNPFTSQLSGDVFVPSSEIAGRVHFNPETVAPFPFKGSRRVVLA